MYPARELTRLADHKASLRRAIVDRRAQCVGAAARVAQPLAWLDHVLIFWRRLPPLAQVAAGPLGFFVLRAVSHRLRAMRSLLRWGPLIVGAVRVLRSVSKTRSRSSER